jgi:hypothetical protein
MANRTLTTAYLSRLSNANHDGVTQQISDRLTSYMSVRHASSMAAPPTPWRLLAAAATMVAAATMAAMIIKQRESGWDPATFFINLEGTYDLSTGSSMEVCYVFAQRVQ